MFASAELGHQIDKETWDREEPVLREDLLEAQFDLAEQAKFPVIILISGVDGAGKGETVNLLTEWMDTHKMQTHALRARTDEERERPPMWRFWRALPPKGQIGIFFGSWYSSPIMDRAYGKTHDADLDASMQEVVRFERMLMDEGALILKFWFHLSKAQQRARFKELESDPKTAWRVTPTDWKHYKLYDRLRRAAERALRQTSTGSAPWTVIEGTDHYYRSLTAARSILSALRQRLDQPAPAPEVAFTPPLAPALDGKRLLDSLDLSRSLPREAYRDALAKYQGRLNLLSRHPKFRKRSVVAVFEGFDAAGKGGSIRRITRALDARQYNVIPVAAPTEEERAQPYLWRFWRQLPRRGAFAIFDRSWYGRVLVERVEELCTVSDWMRAYGEINDFEQELAHHGTVLAKFWLSIDRDEQQRRFDEREQTGYKHYKITEEDWRNRGHWDDYVAAASDMIDRTSTDVAPWTMVEANDKYYARIKVLKTLCERIEAAL